MPTSTDLVLNQTIPKNPLKILISRLKIKRNHVSHYPFFCVFFIFLFFFSLFDVVCIFPGLPTKLCHHSGFNSSFFSFFQQSRSEFQLIGKSSSLLVIDPAICPLGLKKKRREGSSIGLRMMHQKGPVNRINQVDDNSA